MLAMAIGINVFAGAGAFRSASNRPGFDVCGGHLKIIDNWGAGSIIVR
jgi:hypothetical protein